MTKRHIQRKICNTIEQPLSGAYDKFNDWCYEHPNAAAAICGLIITAAYVFAGIVEDM